MKTVFKRMINEVFHRFGLEVTRLQDDSGLKPWDHEFLQWIAEARQLGQDPNDVGDVKWDGNPLVGAEKYLFPYISGDSVVLELGPGTGRYTRHVIGRCKKMILIDYSAVVCDWMNSYLRGKGNFSVHKIDGPVLTEISDSVADMVFANGVLEHIDIDDAYEFLREFHRVLRPGGVLWFNFNTLVTPGGLEWFKKERSKLQPGVRSIFRFYHPEDVRRIAEDAQFSILDLHISNDRLISIHLKRKQTPGGAEKHG